MDRCDVLIVGGGPAGSACAWALRGSGLDVLVLDRKVFPRDKTCAGWVTPPVVETLRIDLDEYVRGRVCQPITGFHTGLLGGREVAVTYDEPVSYGIRRCEFDHYLLQRCGARLRLGETIRTIERTGGRWVINGEIEASLVVGAGGHFCPVGRLLGSRRDEQASVVRAQEVEFEAAADELDRGRIDAAVPELFFCEDLKGYGWCFRKGNFLNIGLGRTDADQLSRHVTEFRDFLRQSGKVACDIPARFHGHAYQLYEAVQPKLVDEGALLIGDSAGLAYPQSGEGIRPAIESGLIAADVIRSAGGDYRPENLEPYRERVLARFGRPRQGGPADWLPVGWLQFLAARLMASAWFSRRVVLDRWFLHRSEPPLERTAGV